MANITTVPSGWGYYDSSAGKWLYSGAIPTPGNGDELTNTTSSMNVYTLRYIFYPSREIGGVTYTNCWVGYIHKPYNASIPSSIDASLVSQIKGQQVVYLGTHTSTVSDYTPLKTITGLPEGVKQIVLYSCSELSSIPAIPSGVRELYVRQTKITSLVLPEGIEKINSRDCPNLTSVNYIPSTVKDLNVAFQNCTNLTGVIKFDGKADIIDNCFQGTVKPIILYGKGNLIPLAKTANNKNVFVNILNRSRIVI